jgi:hypothetical protein
MNLRSLAVGCFAVVILTGCRGNPAPVTAQYNFHDGRYLVEVETVGQGVSSQSSHFTEDGQGNVTEEVEIRWGDSKGLRIENGKLTVNGQDRGTLAKGDRIKVDASGKVLVNGVER